MLNDVLAWQARLFLETGELENAKRVLETLDLEAHMKARIVQARLMLSQGTFHEAWLLLERLLPVAQEQRQIHDVLEIQVLLSLVQQAQRWLQQALSQARAEGFVRLFLSEGEPLARLLRQLLPTLRKPELRSYAQTLLRAFAMTGGEDIPGAASSADLPFESLSAQEQRVLRLLAAGHSNPQIAHELVVSVNTVKDHVKHLYRKLGVSNRLQAVEVGHHLKLI
jgi:LuxR family maltose regulon positive regulatory protein